jgi:hypothetical protein
MGGISIQFEEGVEYDLIRGEWNVNSKLQNQKCFISITFFS